MIEHLCQKEDISQPQLLKKRDTQYQSLFFVQFLPGNYKCTNYMWTEVPMNTLVAMVLLQIKKALKTTRNKEQLLLFFSRGGVFAFIAPFSKLTQGQHV